MHETIFANSQDKNWVDFAKQHKDFFVQNTKRGDLPPTIIAERNGEVFAIVIASEIDKELAFQASHILRTGAGADSLVLILDAHVRSVDAEKGDEFLKNYKHGDMQRACDEEGACELGIISDCLICHRIDSDGKISMKILPYSYHGKGTTFKWTDPDPKHDSEGIKFEGTVPDVLRKIMAEGTFATNEKLMGTAKEHGFSEDRIFYHTARATFQILRERGFYLFDLLSSKHPEWCDAASKAEKIVLLLADKEVLPKVAVPALAKIMPEHIGKPTFQIEVAKILVKYKDRFAKEHAEIPEQAESFANWLHQECFSPDPPPAPPRERRKPPFRVNVWNGDRSEFLGEGEYVGDVTVYFFETEGGISSASNAEEKPEGVPEDKIIEAPNNPKIVLDSGRVVYGCQVYWAPIEEGEKKGGDKQKWPGPKNEGHCHDHNCGCGE
jgi:hypothetical protein